MSPPKLEIQGVHMTKENLNMSIKEADRLGMMRLMDKQEINHRRASERLGISIRQAKRIRKSYLEHGEKGLISRKRGQASMHKTPKEIRDRAISLIQTDYPDFGPTLAGEMLFERHQIKLSAETLRKWMIEEGIWKAKREKERKVYQRRTRRSRFGELLQGDGSPHDWFEGRGEKCCLIHFIDDATNETTSALFVPTETEEGYLECLREHLHKYGRPLSLYVDKHAIFRVNKTELKTGTGITHFGKVAKALGIELICANSPQAKGRVERNNGILQDRLIKEMRLEKINSIEEANAFLPGFLEKYNNRFRKEAASTENAHRPIRDQDNLERIFARQEKRRLSKDLTFQFHGVIYLLETKTPNRLKHAHVDVFWKGNKAIEVEYNGMKLRYRKWSEKVYEKPLVLNSKEIEMGTAWMNKIPVKPAMRHPWR